MRPRVIIHNTISLDGALGGFSIDLALHYHAAGTLDTQAVLVGSNTARHGIAEFMGTVPHETTADRERPQQVPDDPRPLWAIVDSGAQLQGYLHVLRRFEHCRDVLVLVSARTPHHYLAWLRARQYPVHVSPSQRVDLGRALRWLASEHGVTTAHTDTGSTLTGVLLDGHLVDEVSLVISPHIVGESPHKQLFGRVSNPLALELVAHEAIGGGALHLRYRVPETVREARRRPQPPRR